MREKGGAQSKKGKEKKQQHTRKIPKSALGPEGGKNPLVSALLQHEGY